MTSLTPDESESNRLSQSGTYSDKCHIQHEVSSNDSTQSNGEGLTHSCPQVVLSRAGANDSITCNKDKTALFEAVQLRENESVVRELIDAGADVNITDNNRQTPLFYAVQLRENEGVVRALIDAGADVNVTDNTRNTSLFYAVQQSDNESVVRTLIDAGVDLNAIVGDWRYREPVLSYAVQQSNNEFVVRALIDAGAEVNKTGNFLSKTALFYAVKTSNNESVVRALIDAGADVNFIDGVKQNALFDAIQRDNIRAVRVLIDAGININITDSDSRTPLFYAAKYGNKDIVQALIDAGADVTFINKGEEQTALFYAFLDKDENENDEEETSEYAAQHDKRYVVRALLDAGADVNVIDTYGQTALFNALKQYNFNEDAVRALLDAGVDVNVVNYEKRNALFSIFEQWTVNENVFFLLLKAGVDVNVIDEEGQTVLFYAVQQNNKNISCALIDAGADVNIIDKVGQTALFHAVRHGKIEILRALIGAGVDVHVIDEKGQTALFSFSRTLYRTEDVVHALIDAGVDVNVQDKEGKTALFKIVAIIFRPNGGTSSAVRALINAGADVNISDNYGRTALFFVRGSDEANSLARIMIEEGGALVDIKDRDGRTTLFFAMNGSSLSLASYLLEKGANPNLKDSNGTSVVSFFIERCQWTDRSTFLGLCTLYSERDFMHKELALLSKHGVQGKSICKALINALFFKMVSIISSPKTSAKDLSNLRDKITSIMMYCDNNEKIREAAKVLLGKFIQIDRCKMNISEAASQVPGLLTILIEMGAKPNHVDIEGNNALHYATNLPFVGIPQETVMEIFHHLKTFGVNFDVKNNRNETPLQCCFSGPRPLLDTGRYDAVEIKMPFRGYSGESLWHGFNKLVEVWRFCLNQGTSVNGITKDGDSVYHLILKLLLTPYKPFKFGFMRICDPDVLPNIAELMKLSSSMISSLCYLVNHRDENLNTPLHLWASMEQTGEEKLGEGYEAIFKHLLECGARLNERNKNEETPLHLCKTWKAVKLLLDAGAEPNVFDSEGRSPVLSVAVSESNTKAWFPGRFRDKFYPDISQEPKEFFETAIENNLDLWSIDKKGNSILRVFDRFDHAKLLLEVLRDKNLLKSDAISLLLLKSICNDIATRVHWRASLVEIILKARKYPISEKADEDSILQLCCRAVIQGRKLNDDTESSVQWTIVKLLLSYGFKSIDTPGKSGQSCLEIAEKYPPLRELLLKPIDIKDVPLLVPWKSVSNRYQGILEKVARRKESQHTGSFWYHNDHLTCGSFGLVFAGINEEDGREVAIKRIEKLRLQRPEDKREIENLTALADCEQVVRYLSFFEEKDFSYIVLELMEGNLDEYLGSDVHDVKESVNLSKDVLLGLTFLHKADILHRDLKPANILYKSHPKLCLKIADFGLSRRTDSISTTVYGTNVGTRCWIAPEVLKATKDHSKASDVFACGLLLHYILSKRKHPFSPAVCGGKGELQVNHQTEANVMNDSMEGWDNSLCFEATHLIKKMLDYDDSRRPSSAETLDHPLFWSDKKKMDLLLAVGNQPEFECPRAKVTHTLTAVENDLEASFGTIVRHGKWNDPGYTHMPAIYTEMMLKRKMPYDPFSTVELVRFIRNAHAHVSGSTRTAPIRKQLLEDFVFLEYFPNLVMEVYIAVTTHGWDQTREEIKYAMQE